MTVLEMQFVETVCKADGDEHIQTLYKSESEQNSTEVVEQFKYTKLMIDKVALKVGATVVETDITHRTREKIHKAYNFIAQKYC